MLRLTCYLITFFLDFLLCGMTTSRAFRRKRDYGWDGPAKSDLFLGISWGMLAIYCLIVFVQTALA